MRTIIIIAESCEKTTEGAYYPNVNCGSEGALTEKKSKTCTKTYLTFFIKGIKGGDSIRRKGPEVLRCGDIIAFSKYLGQYLAIALWSR